MNNRAEFPLSEIGRPPLEPAALSALLREALALRGLSPERAGPTDWYRAAGDALRRHLAPGWQRADAAPGKRVAYLSMEFLMGRMLGDLALNLSMTQALDAALGEFGVSLDTVTAQEPDAALGNGGLGRLAACFLDSLSTVNCPATGYGLRYEHGLFAQGWEAGRQTERPETWLDQPQPLMVEGRAAAVPVGFGGQVTERGGRRVWQPAERLIARAHDMPVAGWGGTWVNTLRLWEPRAVAGFDLPRFSAGDHVAASGGDSFARALGRVLYPDDTTQAGQELRLRQEYLLCAASLTDILARVKAAGHAPLDMAALWAVQLNDTHPALAAPELIRLLVDGEGLSFDAAMEVTQQSLNYTNHTLMPEALESWSTWSMGRLLPRHMEIVEQIDDWHATRHPRRPASTALVAQDRVRMGNLAFVASGRVNGVSALHTGLMRRTVFADLDRLHPDRIVNQTNGITPRRWIASANPPLAALLTEALGDGWQSDLERLSGLEAHLDDAGFLDRIGAVKQTAKDRCAGWLAGQGLRVDPQAMFDVQVKRFHEYKRQLMNLLHAVALWQDLREGRGPDHPRVKVFGGKAAPGYAMAKSIIRLIHDVAQVVNADPLTRDRLQIVYPANYNVSMAEVLIPAADLSEQISTAGTEASGTGNMKFGLNGALTLGTLDGANVEMREHVGAENFFLFGMTAEEALARAAVPDHARSAIGQSAALRDVLQLIAEGRFSPDEPDRHHAIVDMMWNHDPYLCASDYESYATAQRQVEAAYADPARWRRMSALNTARLGYFSSDRTIRGYMAEIWGIAPNG